MDPNDLRRADTLHSFWDDVALGRAPADPTLVDGEVAELIERLQALGDLPEQDAARARVWHDLEAHPRWKEPDVSSSAFSLNGAIAPPLTLPPSPIQPGIPFQPGRWVRPLAQAAIALLVTMALVAGYFRLVRQPEHASPLPGVATPATEATPAADWPMYKGNAAHTGATAGPRPDGQPVELWRFLTQGPASSSPAIAAGVAYLQSGDGNVYALDVRTGAQRWRVDLGASPSTPAIIGDTLYVNDGVGALVALNAADGAERWRFAEAISPNTPPVVVNGVTYTASDDGTLFALDATTGQEQWRIDAEAGGARAVTVDADLVYLGTEDGAMVVVDAATGKERWRFVSDDTEPTRTPTVANGVVYVAIGSTLYAFDAADGTEQWRSTFGGARPVTTTGDLLYTAGVDGVVYALDPADGTMTWSFNTGTANPTAAPPALAGDTLYAVDGDFALYALDAKTGTEQWEIPLDGSQVNWGPSVADGRLYVGTQLGTLYVFGGSGLAQLMAPGTPQSAPTPTASSASSSMNATPAAAAASPWQTTGGPEPLAAPAGAAVDTDGNVWVVDAGNNQIQIISPDGQFLEAWDGTSGGGTRFSFLKSGGGVDGDIAFAPDGRIYVAEPGSASHRIQVFDRDRTWLATWDTYGPGDGQFIEPESVAIDAQGNVYVEDNVQKRIQKFAPDGTFLLAFGGADSAAGELLDTGYITVDPQGNVLMPEQEQGHIIVFASDGTRRAEWGRDGGDLGQFHHPIDVVTDAFGNTYVADMDNGRIVLLNPQGQALAAWSAGTTPIGAKNVPYAVTLDGNGNLYVVSTAPDGLSDGNVQKFQIVPSLVPVTMATPSP